MGRIQASRFKPDFWGRSQDVGAITVYEVVQDFLPSLALCQHLSYYGPHLERDFHLRLVNGLGRADGTHNHPVYVLGFLFQPVAGRLCMSRRNENKD